MSIWYVSFHSTLGGRRSGIIAPTFQRRSMSRPRSSTPGPVGAHHPAKPSPWGTYNGKGSASDPQTYTSYSSLFGTKFQESQSTSHKTQRGRSPQNPWVPRKVHPGLCGPEVTLRAFNVHSYSLYVSTPSGRLQKGRSQLIDSNHDPLLKILVCQDL